jgi:hypothetical protein
MSGVRAIVAGDVLDTDGVHLPHGYCDADCSVSIILPKQNMANLLSPLICLTPGTL